MDQYLSTVVIAVVTGIFSVITLIIQNKQDSVINKIDSQTKLIEKEKKLKRSISKKVAEQQDIINEIMILILDSNIDLVVLAEKEHGEQSKDYKKAIELKTKYEAITNEIAELTKEYELILDLTPLDVPNQKEKK